jgi:hypothetical protein
VGKRAPAKTSGRFALPYAKAEKISVQTHADFTDDGQCTAVLILPPPHDSIRRLGEMTVGGTLLSLANGFVDQRFIVHDTAGRFEFINSFVYY